MTKILKIVRDLQPILIGLLVLWVFLQKNSSDSFIDDRNRKFKHFSDSLSTLNNLLYIENTIHIAQIDSINNLNDSLFVMVSSLDSSIVKMKRTYEKDKDNISNLSTDATVRLLSENLSNRVGN